MRCWHSTNSYLLWHRQSTSFHILSVFYSLGSQWVFLPISFQKQLSICHTLMECIFVCINTKRTWSESFLCEEICPSLNGSIRKLDFEQCYHSSYPQNILQCTKIACCPLSKGEIKKIKKYSNMLLLSVAYTQIRHSLCHKRVYPFVDIK